MNNSTPISGEGDRMEYNNQLTKNLGRSQPYHFNGEKCVSGCKNFPHYETKHHPDCPFYPGSLSEKMDKAESTTSNGDDWINVKDALPSLGHNPEAAILSFFGDVNEITVIICLRNTFVTIGTFDIDQQIFTGVDPFQGPINDIVTHWKYLPKPPETIPCPQCKGSGIDTTITAYSGTCEMCGGKKVVEK